MSNPNGREAETALMVEGNHAAADYELKHILSVASAYLDAGQVDDAEDLLQEAKDAGADHPDVQALERRLDHIRGRTVSDSAIPAVPAPPDVLLHFTAPLPGVETLPAPQQQLARATERYYASGRIQSALDSTLLACAQAPDFIPTYARLAELQIAIGNIEQARSLLDTILHWHEVSGETPGALVRSLEIALNPSDSAALLEYAMGLVASGDTSLLTPFVPEAISRAVDLNPAAAVELAEAYLALKPDDAETVRLYLKVVSALDDSRQLLDATRRLVSRTSPADLLIYRLVAEATAIDGDWICWLEALVENLRAQPDQFAAIDEQVLGTRHILPAAHLGLVSALVALACEQWTACLDALTYAILPEDPDSIEAFIASYARAIALQHLDDPAAGSALLDAAQRAFSPQVEPFATSTRIFGVSAAPADLLQALTQHDNVGSSIAALEALRQADPTRLEIRSALADAHLAAGNTREAVHELRDIAAQYEQAGDLAGMTDALRKLSHALPSNIEMKATLIEGYLRRGILDEAVNELSTIGDLYLERGRTSDAVAAFTRAAEISAALGAFDRGNTLFDRAVEADPNDVPVRHAAVAFYLQTGSISQATEQLREVVRIALLDDDRDEAVAALHQIIALAPEDPDAYHKLGEVLTSLGEYTQAERVYRRLASFTPYDPVLEAKQSALAVLAATK